MKVPKAIPLIMCAAVLTASTASAEGIPGLFNTGVNNSGERLPYGSLEQHYTLSGTATTAYVFQDGGPITFPGYWVSPAADAMWIGPSGGNSGAPAGQYIYSLTFDLTGLDPTNAWIYGKWASDDASTIFLNGVSTEYTTGTEWPFQFLYDFTINEGFLPGINTLEFRVENTPLPPSIPNPTGLLVQNLYGESVPEPATLLLLGLGALILPRRHRAN